MNEKLQRRLESFRQEHHVTTKGKLSVVLHVTRWARDQGLPLDSSNLRTRQGGQVLGLSRSSIQNILKDYGIHRVLAQEGGRTSRGSLGMMETYVQFLNQLYKENLADIAAVERWWVDRVLDYFASQPFVLRYNSSGSVRSIIQDLLEQAKQRQEQNPGANYIGAMLQHLVGAKLELILQCREIKIIHHGASVADASTARAGDFVIDRVVIHVTTAPTSTLMEKCKENLASGYRPLIITLHSMVPVAEGNAAIEQIERQIDILAADQFLATNLHELSGFQDTQRRSTMEELVQQYNHIIEQHETDPSLRIDVGA